MTQISQVLALLTLLVLIRVFAKHYRHKSFDPSNKDHIAGAGIAALILNVVIFTVFYLAGCFDLILP